MSSKGFRPHESTLTVSQAAAIQSNNDAPTRADVIDGTTETRDTQHIMVDYSKWEKLDVSSDENDGDEDGSQPRVYHIDESEQSFTIPGRNVTINRPAKAALPAAATASGAASSATTAEAKMAARKQRMTRNGGETDLYLWSQDADTATIAFKVPAGTRGKDISIKIEDTDHVIVHVRDTLLLSGHTPSPLDEATLSEEPDWELVDGVDGTGVRIVAVSVRKRAVNGMRMWWKTAFKGHPEISDADLVDRDDKNREKSQSFMAALQEAQELFRAKVAAAKPAQIDL